jgi:glucuronoarabinoxylan endo-1,4-beta-xylanase
MSTFSRTIQLILFSVLTFNGSCKKKTGGSAGNNHSPTATVSGNLTKVNPFTYTFTLIATDPEDPLTFTWDFGEGTVRKGTNVETFTYASNKTFTIKVTVSDGHTQPVVATTDISTTTYTITADNTKHFQTMEGFGGFGAQMEYWGGGPFTSAAYVNTLINDLGLTILRDNIPSNFEIDNDNNDPFHTDLSKYNINNNTAGHDGKLADHLQFLKDMKAAGLQKLIATIWTPAPWMKYNNKVGNGTTDQNSAPAYTTSPDATTNQLKTDMYNEFAEYCVAYIKTIKNETGIDVYALSLQNEPRFSQFYASCVYNGNAMRDVVKVLGKRLEDEGLTTKLFLPEDVGWYDGIKGLVDPVLADADARKYVDIIAVHGYANDGVNPGSTDATTWQNMYNWGAPYNMPLWMTETSGYPNDQDGAISLSKAMYIALKYGNASAWVFWSISTSSLDAYSLMSSSGAKSKRYFASKNYYRYIRPGAQRFEVTTTDAHLLPLAFGNAAEQSTTFVITNDDNTGKPVQLAGTGIPAEFSVYVTSAGDDCKDMGTLHATDIIMVPAKSVVTIYKKN